MEEKIDDSSGSESAKGDGIDSAIAAGETSDTGFGDDISEYAASFAFLAMPAVEVVKASLSLLDVVTDLVVLANWWSAGPTYRTWAIAITAILFVSFGYAVYRAIELPNEASTYAVWGLASAERTWLRILLTVFQFQHVITAISFIKAWRRVYLLQRALGCRHPVAKLHQVVPSDQEAAQRSGLKVRLAKAYADLHQVDADATWWKAYEILFESFPQLLLQGYVILVTHHFYWFNVASMSVSLLVISWTIVAFYNRKIALDWWCVSAAPEWWRQLAFFVHFVGAVGLRTSAIALLLVAQPWQVCVPYMLAIGMSNIVASALFLYHPTVDSCKALACTILVDRGYQTYLDSPAVYQWFTLIGYAGWNFLVASPGQSAYGWHWRHRWFCAIANVSWRFLESWAAIVLVYALPRFEACPAQGPYFTVCNACCRGPVSHMQIAMLTGAFSALYVLGFAVWWPHQSAFYHSAPEWGLERRKEQEPTCSPGAVALRTAALLAYWNSHIIVPPAILGP